MALSMVDRVPVNHHKTGVGPCFPKLIFFTLKDMRTHYFCNPGYLCHN